MTTDRANAEVAANPPASGPRRRARTVLTLLSVLSLLPMGSTPLTAGNPANDNPRVIPPHASPYGKAYEEWIAVYWQWLLSFPANASPAFEQGDVVYGAQGQSGPVWILESGNAGTWERNLLVPAGKALLFSITGAEADTLGSPGASEDELRAMVTAPFEQLTIVASAEVDGAPLAEVDQYLATSPLFEIDVPEPSLFGTPGGTGLAMAQGWFFILTPLPKGPHTIRVTYHVVEFPEVDGDTTYHVTVQ